MTKFSKLFALSFMACLAWGCGPTPEKVCSKMESLAKNSKDAPKDKKDDPKDHDKCVADMEKMKKDDPESFKCVASCTDMSDGDAAMGCVMGCVLKSKSFQDEMKKGGDKSDK